MNNDGFASHSWCDQKGEATASNDDRSALQLALLNDRSRVTGGCDVGCDCDDGCESS